MKPRLAAVTMVYNEANFLPVWLRHYGGLLGPEHCYVIDHGSDDGSTAALAPAHRLCLPRSPHDDARRARFVSRLCGGLLEYYDWVLYTDVDEILLPDPRLHADLGELCAQARAEVITAVGLNLHHLPEEAPIDLAAPLGAQRRWVRFTGALCKPALIRRPVAWTPGFHCADAPICFEALYLIHLRWCDRDLGLARLAKTRAMPWSDEQAGAWQRGTDTEYFALLDIFTNMARENVTDFSLGAPPLAPAIAAFLASQTGREHEIYSVDIGFNIDQLWPLPQRLRALLP